MKKFLLLFVLALSNLLLFSCSSEDEDGGNNYYVKYTVTGGSWYRPPFGHTSQPTTTTIEYQDKVLHSKASQSGKVLFTKVVGPVDSSFKAFLSASGKKQGGSYTASYECTIEILKNGEQLVNSSSNAGSGSVSVQCYVKE